MEDCVNKNFTFQKKSKTDTVKHWLIEVWHFYVDGFKSMTIGRSLWILILIKLFVLFAILKLFFFPDILATQYDNDAERANAVFENLINHQ